jgi:hypothetical protein
LPAVSLDAAFRSLSLNEKRRQVAALQRLRRSDLCVRFFVN